MTNVPADSLAQLITIFNSLPQHEQAAALQQLNGSRRPGQPSRNPDLTHSCSLCEGFSIESCSLDNSDYIDTPKGKYYLDTSYSYASQWQSFTKETLVQGFSRQCLLFQWILSLLDRRLTAFKAEVAHNGSMPQREDHGHPIANLDLLDTSKGLDVRVAIEAGSDRGFLLIQYEPEPWILDNLWVNSSELPQSQNFDDFERFYSGFGRTRLTIYADADDPAADQILSRPAKPFLDADHSFELARQWLDQCINTHTGCSNRAGILPVRVIDVGTRFPIRTVKLYWTEEGETGRWLSLSYCWGGAQTLVTTTATAQEFTDGIPISKIPQTILDAIILTYKLGLRYLWVDALCIIQDDPEDVAREVSKMAQIYQDACVTVSAASARSANEGFLSLQRVTTEPSIKMPLRMLNGQTGSICLQQPQTYSRSENPIHLRAWTLQEHILAQRMLLYGTRALWWTCDTVTHSDRSADASIDSALDIRGASKHDRDPLITWRSIVRDYTRRFLTMPSDKLPGIAGVAAEYRARLLAPYYAGLWGSALISELMWCSKRADITRPVHRRAPSWSWAAVDGEVHHDWCPLSLGQRCPNILFCRVVPVSLASPFGAVDPRQCVLRLEGDLAELSWHTRHRRLSRYPDQATIGKVQADAMDLLIQDQVIVVWALLVEEEPLRGLLLSHVAGNTFTRVGIFTRIWDASELEFERRTIDIV